MSAGSRRTVLSPASTGSRRADVALVEAGIFESRAKAAAAIAAGLVAADGVPVTKPSSPIRSEAVIEASAPHPYVSRGGVKLAAGLDAFSIDPTGLNCLDVGASTGGFTDVLLQRGAARVLAVDVGRDQLHPSLRADPRVESCEGTDIRDIAGGVPHPQDEAGSSFPCQGKVARPKAGTDGVNLAQRRLSGPGGSSLQDEQDRPDPSNPIRLFASTPFPGRGRKTEPSPAPDDALGRHEGVGTGAACGPVDLIVCDASFAPLRVVLPPALALAAPEGRLVALIKPQYEAGRAASKKGIVRDPAVHESVCRDAEALVGSLGWRVLGIVPSPITGGDGNREFLLGAARICASRHG